MQTTTNYKLKKPELTDPVNVMDFNDNTEIIDTELKKRLETTGKSNDLITEFTQAGSRVNLVSGENIKTSFGKLMKWYADLKSVAFSGNASDITEDSTHRFVKDTEKVSWNGAAEKAVENASKIEELNTSLFSKIYPVGSIYLSVNSTSPQTLFGGTWELLKDRFLLGAGGDYLLNDSGGSNKIYITESQMPSHKHSFTGTAVTSANNNTTPTASFTGTAVTSGAQSASHTHSVTAGGTISSESHTHSTSLTIGGSAAQYTTPSCPTGGKYAAVHSETSTFKYDTSSNSHKHTFTGSAVTSGTQSASHTHSVTASGTVSLSNTSHTHSITANGTIGNTGGGEAINNMPPYLCVYMWKRTN